MYDIKKHFIDHKIILLTSTKYKNFFDKSNLMDEILIDNRKGLLSVFLILKKIINYKFEIIIDLQNSQRTSLYIFFIRLFSKIKINATSKYANYRYTYSSNNMPSVIDGLSSQVEILGVKTSRKPHLNWLQNDNFKIKELNKKNYFLINPGCSKKNNQKKWSAKNYAKICTYLISVNILPVIIGSNEDLESINIIQKEENQILNLINNSPLDVVYQLSKNAVGALSNDTGPAHLIAASGCLTYLILSDFSNTKTVIPQGNNVSFIQKKNIEDILPDDVIEGIKQIFRI